MVLKGSHRIFEHGDYKAIHVFDYSAKRKVIVIEQALENQFISGFFYKFKTYQFLTHCVLDKLTVRGIKTFFGDQPDRIITYKIMRYKNPEVVFRTI
jgi:hypothetical protein